VPLSRSSVKGGFFFPPPTIVEIPPQGFLNQVFSAKPYFPKETLFSKSRVYIPQLLRPPNLSSLDHPSLLLSKFLQNFPPIHTSALLRAFFQCSCNLLDFSISQISSPFLLRASLYPSYCTLRLPLICLLGLFQASNPLVLFLLPTFCYSSLFLSPITFSILL